MRIHFFTYEYDCALEVKKKEKMGQLILPSPTTNITHNFVLGVHPGHRKTLVAVFVTFLSHCNGNGHLSFVGPAFLLESCFKSDGNCLK